MAREVKITIGAETSKYERAMRDVRMSTRRTTSFISSAWLKAAGSMYALMKGWELAKLGAQAQQEAASFASLAASYGASADHIIAKLKEASAGTVDTMTLVQKAGTAMMMGISPDKISKLMEIARATARQTGQSVTKAFEDISLAVGRQSRMILDNLGIIVKAGDANEQYARELGKTANQLTETEKKQAFLNATVAAGEDLIKRLGDQTKTTAEMFQSFEAMMKNLKVWVGQALVFVGKWSAIIWTKIVETFAWGFQNVLEIWEDFFQLWAKVPGFSGMDLIAEKVGGLAAKFEAAKLKAQQFKNEVLNIEQAAMPAFTPAGPDAGAAPGIVEPDKEAIEREKELLKAIEQERKDHLQRMMDDYELLHPDSATNLALRDQQAQEALQRTWELWQSEENALSEHLAIKMQMNEQAAREELQRMEQFEQAKIKMAENRAATINNIELIASQFSGKIAKGVFIAARAFEISKATIAAFAAYNQALAYPPGPPATIPMAAWALGAGLSNAAAIAATTFGQLSSGGAASSPGGSIAQPVSLQPEPIAPVAESGQAVVNIHFEGDVNIEDEAYIEKLAEKISEAVEGRDVYLAASNARFAENLS